MPRTPLFSFALALCIAAPAAVAGNITDVVTVGSGTGTPGTNVDIALFIRDSSGTPLGIDQPPGSRIQSYSIKVDYAPAASIQSVTFSRAGITASLTPIFESSPSAAGSISALDTFSESTNPIPFTSNAAAPGNQIGVLHFMLAASAAPGTVTLTIDTTLTQLSSESGSGPTSETTSKANLSVVNGSITVNPTTPVRLQSFDVH
jgi:hypothetical protein